MDCKHAYTQQGIKYILCDKAEEPTGKELCDIAHSICPFQMFCELRGCQRMIDNWFNYCKIWKDDNPATTINAGAVKKTSTSKKKSK